MEIPMELVRLAGMNILPPDGAWVIFKGNPYTSRGLRVPTALRNEGVKHFDIYYAYDEGFTWHHDENETKLFIRDLGVGDLTKKDAQEYLDQVCDNNGISPLMQSTWVTLHTPSSKLIRAWCGEVAVLSRKTIDDLLTEDYIEIVTFSKQTLNPVWDEITRDMIGSFMIDGLSFNEAQDELIRAGEKFQKAVVTLPSYFYRPIGEFREQFSEEPEYEAWYADKKQEVEVGV